MDHPLIGKRVNWIEYKEVFGTSDCDEIEHRGVVVAVAYEQPQEYLRDNGVFFGLILEGSNLIRQSLEDDVIVEDQ